MVQPSISRDALAALLLHAPADRDADVKHLTLAEYNDFAKWLKDHGFRPADVLSPDVLFEHQAFPDAGMPAARLQDLVGRRMAFTLLLDKWEARGLWVVSRSDDAYPRRLRQQLKHLAPPFLFCSGELGLLNRPTVCAVGSRHPTDEGLEFARCLGAACAEAGIGIVSGAAAGIDREAMAGAMFNGGFAVGIMAEGLTRAVGTRENRELLRAGRLCLVSPFMPDARWLPSRAMERNKFLYGTSVAAVVVDSDVKGGTWAGAQENLRNRWVVSAVRDGRNLPAGNKRLLSAGLPAVRTEDILGAERFTDWLDAIVAKPKPSAEDLFAQCKNSTERRDAKTDAAVEDAVQGVEQLAERGADEQKSLPQSSLYAHFIGIVSRVLSEGPLTEKEISEKTEVVPAQAKVWLKRAEDNGLVAARGRPRRYHLEIRLL